MPHTSLLLSSNGRTNFAGNQPKKTIHLAIEMTSEKDRNILRIKSDEK